MSEKPVSHYLNLHKQYLEHIVNFKYSFEKGNKDPIKRNLEQLKRLPRMSISGEQALLIYEKAKKLGLYLYPPVIMRVYLGQLILKIKPDGSPGFIKFIKFVEKEAKSLRPLLKKQIGEVVKLVKKYGGKRSSATIGSLKKMVESESKVSTTSKHSVGREVDPIFDEETVDFSEDEFQNTGIEDLKGNIESRLSNLDPFQTVFYKLLIEKGYKKFRDKIIKKTGGLKKFVARKEGIQAINRFNDWIVATTRAMSFSKGKGLLQEFDKRLSQISFPSLKITMAFGALTIGDYRTEARKSVVEGLNKMKPLIKELTGFPPELYRIIGRTGGYATGKNRVFLNRFYRITVDRYKKSSGDQKYIFEFIALALDRIKDDEEFAKLSTAMKPVIARLLRGSSMINQLSKKVLKKPVNQLTQKQIMSLLDYVLPTRVLDENQKQTELNKKMLTILKQIDGALGVLKKSDPGKYKLIANILHIAKNDIVSIGTEKNPEKAKKGLARFYERFRLVRSLIGENFLTKIQKTNKYLYMFITSPETTISFMCAFNQNITYVKKRFEAIKHVKKPAIVVLMTKEASVTKKYLQQRFRQAQLSGDISLIQKYGNQMRAVDMAIGLLNNCWTDAQFRKNEDTIRTILHETPYLMVSKNIQKYIDLVASVKVEKSKQNYKSLLGVTYDINKYLSNIVRNKLLAGKYGFAKGRLTEIIKKIVDSYGYSVEKANEAKGLTVYDYLKKYQRTFVSVIVARVNIFLKSARFRDENGKNYRLYGLNKVQVALLKRKMIYYLSKEVLPKVEDARQA